MNPRKLYMVGCVLFFGGLSLTAWQQVKPWDGDNFFVEPEKHPGAKIVVVEEVGERHNETAIFARNTTLHDSLTSKGLKWGIYDDDSPDATVYRNAAEHAGVGLPALVIVAANRDVLRVVKWPVTDMDATIKEVTGL